MRYFKLMKTYPFQVFRHRVYIPLPSLLGVLGDFRRGVTTQKIIELNELGLNPDVGVRFETVSYGKLHQAFKVAKNEGFDKFCDNGCGLGRSLMVADEVGFNDLYGVDISPELIHIAKNNLNKRNVSAFLSCSDVDSFLVPSGRLAIYLFNPFGKERMTPLISKLKQRQS
ncbi:class I SAM-dependent methyltransferase [Planktomarina temperata]|nr:class I SAM-dependent methyltransferase [Planktomarina temperata]